MMGLLVVIMAEGIGPRFSALHTFKPSTSKPEIPEDWITESIKQAQTTSESVFLPWVAERIQVEWLDPEDDRFGITRFEEGPAELVRRRRLRLDPGVVTIALHPALEADDLLYKHTFVHEFLHACGLISHSENHENLTRFVAPMPSISQSPLLRMLRDGMLEESSIENWECKKCGYSWERKTVRRPKRCLKCARPLE